jgi:hypothetical protein
MDDANDDAERETAFAAALKRVRHYANELLKKELR